MRPVKNDWPATPSAVGIKFFAQLMREMLSADSFESFRVHSLDTLARLTEALGVLEDISRQRLPLVAIDPVISELIWSLRRDPVANVIASNEIAAFMETNKDGQKRDARMLKAQLNLLSKRLCNNYRSALERKLIELHDDDGRKSELRIAVSEY
jgi:hypothetical protein